MFFDYCIEFRRICGWAIFKCICEALELIRLICESIGLDFEYFAGVALILDKVARGEVDKECESVTSPPRCRLLL